MIYQKYVFDIETNTLRLVEYERACLIFKPLNYCTDIIGIDVGTTYTPPDEYYYLIDDEGQIGWTWGHEGWIKPTDILLNGYLGENPTAETATLTDESNRLATTFYVAEKIQDFIYNIWTQNGVLDGGSFGDAAPITLLNAGIFNDTNYNLETDYISPVFNNTGGNLTSDITASTY